MKRLIVAAVLSVIIIVSLIFSILYVNSVCVKTVGLLDECISTYENNRNAYKKAEALSKYWGKEEKFLSLFVNHESLDEVESAIKSLKDYSDTKENELFHEYCGTLRMLIHQLSEDTIPGIHSIF